MPNFELIILPKIVSFLLWIDQKVSPFYPVQMEYFRQLRPQESMCLGAPFLEIKNRFNSGIFIVNGIFSRQKWSTQTHTFLVWKGSKLCDLYRVEGERFLTNLRQETHDFGRNAQHEVGCFLERRRFGELFLLSENRPTLCWALRPKSWVSCCKLIEKCSPSTLYKSHN